MTPVLAHAVGSGQFPVPLWAVGYGTGALLVLLALALRTGWPKARLPWPAAGPEDDGDAGPPPAVLAEATATASPGGVTATAHARVAAGAPAAGRHPLRLAAGALGLVCWAGTIVAAFVGEDSTATNITYYAVVYGLLLGGIALSLVHGDAWTSVNPFATVARIALGRTVPERTARPMPAWTAPVMLATLGCLLVAFRPPLSPRTFGLWLVAHTLACLAGTAVWGRAWLREGEGFAVLFGHLGRLAPLHHDAAGRLRLRPPLVGAGRTPDASPGAVATLVVLAGVALFDAVRDFQWWVVDVVGQRSTAGRALVHSAGLAFAIVLVALVWTGAARVAARVLADRQPWGGALAVLAAGFVVSRYTSLCIRDGWNLVGLLSDPLGRHWDLVGTASWLPPLSVANAGWVAWVEVLAVVLGGAAAVVLAHDAALAAAGGNRRRAATAVLPVHGAAIALTLAGIGFLLGG